MQNSWWIADAKVFLLARWRIRQIWYSQKIKSWHFQLLVAIIFELIRSMIYCDMWCLVLELAQSTEIMAWNINQVLSEWNRNQGEMVDATDVKINALSNSVHLCSCVCSCFDILFLFNRRFALVTNNVLSIIWVFWFTRAIRIWSIFLSRLKQYLYHQLETRSRSADRPASAVNISFTGSLGKSLSCNSIFKQLIHKLACICFELRDKTFFKPFWWHVFRGSVIWRSTFAGLSWLEPKEFLRRHSYKKLYWRMFAQFRSHKTQTFSVIEY